uniref:Integrin alpha-2 domain-containing protein n=1 Tax=Oryzias sinensis TaxID=183150 RepID=A0A8C7XZI1_9TELE
MHNMLKLCLMVTLWIILHFQLFNVAAFNLDTENVMQKKGDPGTLFGFSVAFHEQLSPARKKLLLVGAPRAKHQDHVNVTGVVYMCDLSTTSEHCQPIKFDHKEFLSSKGTNNQWMGIKVTSQGVGKNVMACAHRYQHPSPYSPNLLTGQCYLLGDHLQVGTEERTWRRVVCDNEHLANRRNNHEWFAYCQQGHGASFAKDNTSVLFGAPGAYQWKGIVRMEPLDNLDYTNENSRETGFIDRFDQEVIPLQANSYLGFSVDSGMSLVGRGELTIVSGAPRGGFSGQVAFLKADPEVKTNLLVEQVLSGPGLASSFGYDLAVVDLNADGWEDLAVGAPQFYMKNEDVGGAVFIYINRNGKHWDNIVPVPLHGERESMFGLAVENLGDINRDGYGDIAVGAPYEGSGRVYIYCGSAEGVHKKASQVISPALKTVNLFGYSLSCNMDIDNNQYPDLAVGSLSDSVFVFRARPVVSVRTDMKIKPNHVNIIKQRCDEQTCAFAGQACFAYTAQPASYNPKLTLNYIFEADSERRTSRSRVEFLFSPQGKLELPEKGKQMCTDIKLRLLRDIRDKLSSIPVSVTVSLWSSEEMTRMSADESRIPPVLNLYQQKTTVSEIIIINDGCGDDNICKSNLQIQYKFCSKKTQNGEVVFTPLVRQDGIAVITPTDEDIALEITVTNRHGDDAHQSHVIITLPDTLRYSSVVHRGKELSCSANENGTLIDCELGNPFHRDAELTYHVILTTSGISLSTRDVNGTLQLQTTSVQNLQPVEVLARVVFELELKINGVVRPSQVSLGDILKGESAIHSLEEIGASVQFDFKIINLGRPLKYFSNASLNVFWPKETSVGKWLLYLTHISTEGVRSVPCSPANEINPLKDVKGWNAASRRKRHTKLEALSSEGLTFLSKKRKFKTLSCSDGLTCVEIRCPLVELDSTAMVVLHSHLWNATLAEDYSHLHFLDIVVDVTLSLNNAPGNIGLKSETNVTQVKLTVFFERKTEFLTKVAWWIILLTVVTLLLLLCFLAYILWKYKCIHHLTHKKKPSEDPAEHLKG